MTKIPMCLLFFFLLFAAAAPAQELRSEAWLEDFYQLLSEMSSHYANLEWAAKERRVDLPKLKARTEDRLQHAKNEEDAHRAFAAFVNPLGDAHVEIRWQARAKGGIEPASAPWCDRLGYNQQDNDGGIDWSIFPEYKALYGPDAADFPGGLLRMADGRTIGTIRIGLFSEEAHPALCKQAQQQVGKADDAPCDDKCQDEFELVVSDLLTAALERRLHALQHAGANTILVDITENGGGTNWVEPAARVLTPFPLKSPRLGFVKGEHWATELKDRQALAEADLPKASGEEQAILRRAAEVLKTDIAEASTACDRSVLWSEPPSALHCTQVVAGPLYTSGVLQYAKPGAFAGLRSGEVLFYPGRFRYHEGVNKLPLIVLVDGNTASSAEYFAAMLQDNHAATIIGQVTVGAGCGYTNGGIPTVLKNSGAQVRMPDCIRYRADGSDEVSGVTPDILLPWADRDSKYQESLKLKRWLETAHAGARKAWRASGRHPAMRGRLALHRGVRQGRTDSAN